MTANDNLTENNPADTAQSDTTAPEETPDETEETTTPTEEIPDTAEATETPTEETPDTAETTETPTEETAAPTEETPDAAEAAPTEAPPGETEEAPTESATPTEEAGATETSIYDPQPETVEDVQAAIEAFENTPDEAAQKPHWENEVPADLMPGGWVCQRVDWDEDFGAEYYTFFLQVRNLGTFNGGNAGLLQQAIDAAFSGDTIFISKSFALSAELIITKKITITSVDPNNPVTLTSQAAEREHFEVSGDGQLTLENIILDGNNSGGGIYVDGSGDNNAATGSLTLNTGAEIWRIRRQLNAYTHNTLIKGAIVMNNNAHLYINDGALIHENEGECGGMLILGSTMVMTG
ncbi:MAG: hypothetical protein LBU77_03080, partial [Clostridiales bacterium]|nr:hypothetical protein [Clostridiales bacterium]